MALRRRRTCGCPAGRSGPVRCGTGAASGQVQPVTATLRGAGVVRLVRKTFIQLTSGPHAEASRRLDHWAYWRRELTAYRSGVLPTGPGLRAARLYGTFDDVLYTDRSVVRPPSARGARRRSHDATAPRPAGSIRESDCESAESAMKESPQLARAASSTALRLPKLHPSESAQVSAQALDRQ